MRSPLQFVAISAIALAAACGGGDSGTPTGTNNNPGNPGNPSTPANPVVTTAVTIGNDFFDPANIQVSPGATVTWTWPSGVAVHNVTFADVTSGDKGPGSSFSKSFPTAGTFTYSCTIHGGMSGTVLVK
jgi:plastocyanin